MENELQTISLNDFYIKIPKNLVFQSKCVIPLKSFQIVEIPCFFQSSSIPKYIFKLLDAVSNTKLKLKTVAIFIIPQGQENS